MSIKGYIVDAFTNSLFGGNPAGVVLLEEHLAEETMARIAKEFNLSETVFIRRISDKAYKTRFFTPTEEVGLCGHATIAGFYTLAKEGYFNGQSFPFHVEQQTSTENLKVTIDKKENDYHIEMEQSTPLIYEEDIDKEEIAEILGIDSISLSELPPRIVSTGLRDLFLSLKTREGLREIEVNEDALSRYSRRKKITGVHAYTLDSEIGTTAHCRNFAPAVGIPEEAATGTASGALSYYLIKEGVFKLESNQSCQFTYKQGEGMERPSTIQSTVKKTSRGYEIYVSGSARIFMKGNIEIHIKK